MARHTAGIGNWGAVTRVRRPRIQLFLALVIGVVAAAALPFAQPSNAAPNPSKVLQVVHVGVDGSGAITDISRSDIAQDKSGYHARSSSLDPQSTAGDLPVRVSTNYSTATGSGTDLRRVGGSSGLIHIAMTVTNQTARAKRLTYTDAGRTITRDALVATPFTVIATAQIPHKSVTSFVSSEERGAPGSMTNGTIATLPNGDYAVQWAAILAPPALSPSATFDMVLNAKKFAMRGISIDVVPGVTADPSLESLITTQFGSRSPLQGLENNTISLISDVQSQLQGVRADLARIRGDLDVQVKRNGDTAHDNLLASRTSITRAVESLRTELTSLQGSLTSSLTNVQNGSRSAFAGAIGSVIQSLGLRPDLTLERGYAPTSSVIKKGVCGFGVADSDPHLTIFQQLQLIQLNLSRLGESSGACLAQARQKLDASIGSILGSDSATDSGAHCATVTLTCLGASLGGLQAEVFNSLDDGLAAEYDALTEFTNAAGSVADEVKTLRCLYNALAPEDPYKSALNSCDQQSVDDSSVRSSIAALAQPVDALTAQVGTASAKLDAARDALSKVGVTQGPKTANSIVERATSVEAAVCATPTNEPLTGKASDYAKQLRDAAGVSCDGETPSATATYALSKLGAANKSQVRTLVDALSAASTALDAHGAIQTALDSAASSAATVQNKLDHLDKTDQSGFHDALDALRTSLKSTLDGLGNPSHLVAATSSVPAEDQSDACGEGPARTPLDQLCTALYVDRRANASIKSAQNQATAGLASASAKASQVKDGVSNAQTNIDDKVSAPGTGVIAVLQQQLSQVGSQQLSTGGRRLADAGKQLDLNGREAMASVDARVLDLRKSLAREVTTTRATQRAQSGRLTNDVLKVLTVLGTAHGHGIFGQVANSAIQVGNGEDQIGAANQKSSNYQGVRQAQVADSLLAEQQQNRGLDQAASYPAFHERLPTGSTHTTAFVFDIAGVQ